MRNNLHMLLKVLFKHCFNIIFNSLNRPFIKYFLSRKFVIKKIKCAVKIKLDNESAFLWQAGKTLC